MSRIARVVVPGLPHHITQRGNRRERAFFEDGDYALAMAKRGRKRRLQEEAKAIKTGVSP
jgi:REP element-mobilizing transposase RayT